MSEISEITISDTDLIKILAKAKHKKAEDGAKKIISETKKVSINWNLATVEKNQTSTSITLKIPPDLGVDRWIIVLATDQDEIIAVLTYDPETGEFPVPDDNEDDGIPDTETVANVTGGRRRGSKK
jgi:hypothetical protein